MTSLVPTVLCALAFLSRCPMILASPIFWNFHCNVGFIFPASCNDLLMGNPTPAHSLVRGSFWNCTSLLDSFTFISFMLAKPVLLGWFFQVLLVWNVAWFLYTIVIVISACLWDWPKGTCFHRLPFWISKLLWWSSQFRFPLLNEFHKLGFWMEVWGLALRELFLFPRCRTQIYLSQCSCDSCRSFSCLRPHCFIALDTRLSSTDHSFRIFLVSLLIRIVSTSHTTACMLS